MKDHTIIPTATFVNTTFVDEKYHQNHAQLIHQHDTTLELLYITQGIGSYIVSGHNYIIQPGNLVICNSGVLHGEPPFEQSNMRSYCCALTDLQLPGLPPNSLMEHSSHPVLFFSQDRLNIEYILLTLHSLNTQPDAQHIYSNACNLLANALLHLVYIKLQNRIQPAEFNFKGNRDFIQSITEYLDEHFMESFSLPDLGDIFHMSHYYLSRVYKAETGVSPMKYVTYRRIGESQNLLMNTDMTITAIGEKLGFSDNCHFSSMFKQYVGTTPTQYRQYFQPHRNTQE